MLVKFIGGIAHGKILDVDIEGDRLNYTWVDYNCCTKQCEYDLVYYNHNFKCEPLKYKGKFYMIKSGMKCEDSRTIIKIIKKLKYEEFLKNEGN